MSGVEGGLGGRLFWAALTAAALAGLAAELAGHGLVAVGVLWGLSAVLLARFAVGLARGRFTVDLLMGVAGAVAAYYGLLLEGLAVMALYGVAESIEEAVEALAARRIRALEGLLPPAALVERGGRLVEVDPGEVEPGDVVVVRRGEAAPVDLRLLEPGLFDLSHVTGEPGPVELPAGSVVPSGSVNASSPVRGVAVAGAGESFMQRLIGEALEALEEKAGAPRAAERAAPYITAVVLAAYTAAHALLGPERALSILLAGCPSAFLVSAAYSTALAAAALASRGVLARGGRVLWASGSLKAAVLDKTGTLTEPVAGVARVEPPPGMGEGELLALASSLARASLHPMSRALASTAAGGLPVEGVREVPGAGVEGLVAGRRVALGGPRILGGEDAAAPECPGGSRPLYVHVEGAGVGVVCLAERLRPDAREAVEALKGLGLRVYIASGDRGPRVREAAEALGVDGYYEGLRPEDKVRAVREVRGRHGPVLFAGDGVNDAPALAEADVGLAVGGIAESGEAADAASPSPLGAPLLVIAGRAYRAAVAAGWTMAAAVKAAVAAAGLKGSIPLIAVAAVGDDGSTLAAVAASTLAAVLAWRRMAARAGLRGRGPGGPRGPGSRTSRGTS